MGRDPDLRADARMMVPVAFDLASRRVRVWAFLEWRRAAARVGLQAPPVVRAERAGGAAEVVFTEQVCAVDVPEVVEVEVGALMGREAFRRVFDARGEREAIVRALEE